MMMNAHSHLGMGSRLLPVPGQRQGRPAGRRGLGPPPSGQVARFDVDGTSVQIINLGPERRHRVTW